jgi:xanthine dehydrogenase YagS FAD-binding subunit
VRPFEYASAATLEDALGQLGRDGAVRPLAGGTDLLTLMKAELATPERLVDVKRVAGLSAAIEDGPDGVTIGALATLADLESSALLRERCAVLGEAAAVAATPQLRNMATVGGNLLQRPRCWYFRGRHADCWLKGGSDCPARAGENQLHALFGDGPCVAVHPSDLAPALVALDAELRLRGPAGERSMPLAELFAEPEEGRRTETRLRDDELILSLWIPRRDGAGSSYQKAMDRRVWAFALVSVAAVVSVEAGRVADARVVLGGVAPIPWRSPAAEQALRGAALTRETIARAADAALEGARPLAQNGYKVALGTALVRRALTAALATEAGRADPSVADAASG